MTSASILDTIKALAQAVCDRHDEATRKEVGAGGSYMSIPAKELTALEDSVRALRSALLAHPSPSPEQGERLMASEAEPIGFITKENFQRLGNGFIAGRVFPKGTLRPDNEVPLYTTPRDIDAVRAHPDQTSPMTVGPEAYLEPEIVSVPREPTEAMLDAMVLDTRPRISFADARDIWDAALAALSGKGDSNG